MEHKVLVVEDERGINDAIVIYLRNQGYQVYQAFNGAEGLDIVLNNDIHLAIVDIMMPVMDGMEMTLKIRENYDFPIIFLSAKSEDIDKISGLNIGADDYMTKPFKSIELIARVGSHIRRYEQILRLKGSKEEVSQDIIEIGGISLNKTSKEVSVDGKYIKMTPKEFSILELLMSYPNRVFSSEEIYERIWKEEAINTETIMVHIRKLREKIEIDPKRPKYLKVVWGLGYKIEKR